MNKNDFIKIIMKESGMKKEDAKQSVSIIFSVLKSLLLENERVTIPSFGTFYLKPRAKKKGFLPWENSPMIIPEGMTIKFEPAVRFREDVKEKYEKKIIEEELIPQA